MYPDIHDPITYQQMEQLLELLTFFQNATPVFAVLLVANFAASIAGAFRR